MLDFSNKQNIGFTPHFLEKSAGQQIYKKFQKSEGFTLIELLVVVTIIGLLSTMVLVSLNTARMKARDVRRLADLRQVALGLEMYYDDNASTGYPGTSGSNNWAAVDSSLEPNYMSSVPTDPGNGSYEYWVDTNNQSYVLGINLEDGNNSALNGDSDGSIFGCDCDDPKYCIQL
ncbi:prepilin-type N-terminal cleavage/methylation domain-containing protein [Patescibacteria group bacterium]|nr:prepilin-type N-terminal cleavage/methylation domain-containing protein [Patescibacteria group bacterium]